MKGGCLQALRYPAQLSQQSQMGPVAVFNILIFNSNKDQFQPPFTRLPARFPPSILPPVALMNTTHSPAK